MKQELLDQLEPEDPTAMRSRRDLRRINAWMSSARVLASALKCTCGGRTPTCLVELGAGDGTLLLKVARRLGWRGIRGVLVDKEHVVSKPTLQSLRELGWEIESIRADAIDWLAGSLQSNRFTAMLCNLFLHHLTEAQLAALFALVSRKAEVFVASEPRRSAVALLFSRMVGLIGANNVTRHDAPASVRAGFTECELSRLWPQLDEWITIERPEGLFSHLFAAHLRA